MERLTYRGTTQMTEDGLIVPSYSDYSVRKIIERLADYEDAEEQGLLLRLPCRVGDTVYTIPVRGKKEIEKKRIQNVEYRGVGYKEGQRFFINASATAYVESDIGKYMFFTKEEAEQALAERKNDE